MAMSVEACVNHAWGLQGDLVGVVGWLRRTPTTKLRKNGEAVLLLDLEDEHATSIRIICLGAVRERYSLLAVATSYLHEASLSKG